MTTTQMPVEHPDVLPAGGDLWDRHRPPPQDRAAGEDVDRSGAATVTAVPATVFRATRHVENSGLGDQLAPRVVGRLPERSTDPRTGGAGVAPTPRTGGPG
ncbi:hypothetical protein [Pseudonocardia acidicola]|uniref:Uncharacterized protein n=1 Tax=Pseudonocardia acidicola TaxID=2724939 RepID=A0ABX1SBI6_9PSEU|nr:hypothetical protein [Pseudonocardia acidicola]NMH98460.1 hypothetical protein [Pseudonocardia acidicola]